MSETAKGHLSAGLTVAIWALTFISTKVLLKDFLPIEILFIRFLIGFISLLIVSRKIVPFRNWREERYYLIAGLLGVFLYYYLENVALTFTLAMNVGVIGSVSPFMTALISRFILKQGTIPRVFVLGFICSMIGISLISFSGTLNVNPLGDGLALLATVCWAAYSLIVKKISTFGQGTIAATQRIFFYGLLWMVPVLFFSIDTFDFSRFTQITNFGNLIFLGVGASALCFVTWNFSVKTLGAVRAAVYIYTIPMLTTLASVLILAEPLTVRTFFGILLTLTGLVLSELPNFLRQRKIRANKRLHD
ncbi:DMT family transporter [Enterococcus xiangfangensis]|uniref:DMT family transporter n=1 Tax=Enterococcus xiangfangensis TaxID=1296537 RepID=UPI0010F69573|nr:DMT family transporter [Enterococcus xiangfangensis]MBM7711641.1 drug/metabolite transporter (DMT)-like permease [Enterococcus xiangfangensis]